MICAWISAAPSKMLRMRASHPADRIFEGVAGIMEATAGCSLVPIGGWHKPFGRQSDAVIGEHRKSAVSAGFIGRHRPLPTAVSQMISTSPVWGSTSTAHT